jgi:hypothetical protein
MSYEIAIINPRTGKKKTRRRASAKQLAARRRFIAKFARGRKVRRNPAKRRKKSSIHSGVSVMAKRRRRSRTAKGRFVKKSHKSAARRTRRRKSSGSRRPAVGYTVGSRKIRRRKLNPRMHRRRRYKRNPFGLGRSMSVSGILGQLVPAAYGAGGAVALNLALSYLPLPDALKTGWPKNVTRLAGAMLIGTLARKFLGARGNAVGAGALTVVVYDIVKGLIATAAPDIGVRLGEFEDVTLLDDGFVDAASPVRGFGAYLEGEGDDNEGTNGLSAYLEGNLDGNMDGMGQFNYA